MSFKLSSVFRKSYSTAKVFAAVAALLLAMLPLRAEAVPAFAVQTGQACQACHIGAFGPQLTPFGRQFKLNGYTMRAGGFTPPVSAMAVASYVHTLEDQSAPPAPHYATNNNTTIDEVSLFIAGGYGDHFGSFAQVTYDGVGRSMSWDNLDLRFVDHATVAGSDVLWGLSLNNNPTIQDAWATLPGWGFPFTDSGLAPAPSAGTLLSGALAQNALGLSAYAWWDDHIYSEFGLYTSLSPDFLKTVGVDPADTSSLRSAAPYVRFAYQKDYGDQNFELGAFGLFASLNPGRDTTTGLGDRYNDIGVDVSYQYTGDGTNIVTANARYVNESQSLKASQALGDSFAANLRLNEISANASYYYKNTYGFSVGAFNTWGSADPLLYGANSTFKPDSSGFNFQLDVTPFGGDEPLLGTRANVRAGIQYTAYTKFDGAASNYDGLGHNASDNNTLRIFVWTAF